MDGPPMIHNGGPYVVGSYPPKSSFLSQSSEQITGCVESFPKASVKQFECVGEFDGVMTPKWVPQIGKTSTTSIIQCRSTVGEARTKEEKLEASPFFYVSVIFLKFHFRVAECFVNKLFSCCSLSQCSTVLPTMKNELRMAPKRRRAMAKLKKHFSPPSRANRDNEKRERRLLN